MVIQAETLTVDVWHKFVRCIAIVSEEIVTQKRSEKLDPKANGEMLKAFAVLSFLLLSLEKRVIFLGCKFMCFFFG